MKALRRQSTRPSLCPSDMISEAMVRQAQNTDCSNTAYSVGPSCFIYDSAGPSRIRHRNSRPQPLVFKSQRRTKSCDAAIPNHSFTAFRISRSRLCFVIAADEELQHSECQRGAASSFIAALVCYTKYGQISSNGKSTTSPAPKAEKSRCSIMPADF